MSTLVPELCGVNDDNLEELVALSDTLTASQQNCVASNLKSVAQGSVSDTSWYRGIYLDKQAIGFIMLELYTDELPLEDQPALYLWRFMMARPWQGKGYGRQVLDQVLSHFGSQGVKTLYTSVVLEEPDGPYQFYLGYGFTDTGRAIEGEQILRYALPESCGAAHYWHQAGRDPLERPWEFVLPKPALLTIWTDQLEPMKRFYREVLGLFVKQDHGAFVEFELRSLRFALCERSVMAGISPAFGQAAAGQRFELAFPCDSAAELDTAWSRLLAWGAVGVAAPADLPWGQRAAFFADPDGNIHELFVDPPPPERTE
jgi:catechol 2,3-dioxygenase-like lactoylglutathione lyase family enzyme/GNAT superfamily N-acetyltransferase